MNLLSLLEPPGGKPRGALKLHRVYFDFRVVSEAMAYLDPNGKVLAMKNTVVAAPWIVLESSKFPGRFYYYNQTTKKHAWALDPSLVGGNTLPDQEAETSRREGGGDYGQSKPSNLPLLVKSSSSGDTDRLLGGSGSSTSQKSAALPPMVRRGSLELRMQRELLSIKSHPRFDSFEDDAAEASLPDSSKSTVPFRVVKGLGQGGYGVVMEVEHTSSKRRYAMKVVSKDNLRRRRDRERLALELRIVEGIGLSPFVQQFHMSFETVSSVFIVMDLQGGGDLFFHLMERIGTLGTAFSEREVCVLMAELTLALEHVHCHGYIHRDLKIENVMLDSVGHVKLIDFGLAIELTDDVQPLSPTGSLIYMAPEMIVQKTGGRHTDWWALGVLAHELLLGESPWSSIDDKHLLRREIQHRHVHPPADVSPATGQFITMLLQKDYRMRLGSRSDSDVKDAAFFEYIDWEKTGALEAAPAFTPPANSVGDEEIAGAEQRYRELSEAEKTQPRRRRSSTSNMGLPLVSSFPK